MVDKFEPSSGLGWIDFSEEDKGKVMKVIELLKEEGTVDELGIGVIRNSLSDAMFNGITTIQTRAKYFFIIPRIIQSYLAQKKHKVSPLKYLYDEETRIMNELTWALDKPEEQGIIGYTVALENKEQNIPKRRWKQVERKPSTIYWNGLRTFGFLNTELSLSNLLKAIEKNEKPNDLLDYMAKEDEKGDDKDSLFSEQQYFNLPYQSNWENNISIDLTDDEASFLKHQIIDTQKDQLLALVLGNNKWIDEFLDADSFEELSKMPFVNELPEGNKKIINTARYFWKIFKGAHIRYNVILHEKYGLNDSKENFIKEWEVWKREMDDFDWEKFDRDLMWEITRNHSRVKYKTEYFINNWIEGIKHEYAVEELNKLVEDQEKFNKGSRAKLRDANDELYQKRVGINNMDYRFGNVKRIIKDIALGLAIIND